MQALGSIPKHGISLCMVGRRRVEEELREFSFQAAGSFIVMRSPVNGCRSVIINEDHTSSLISKHNIIAW